MKNIFLIFFLFISSSSFSQTIHVRVLSAFSIEISADTLTIDSSKNILKTANPRVNITEGQIEIIDGDTTAIYFKGIPKLSKDDELFYRYWEDAINENGLECVVLLSHYKKGKDIF